VSALSIIATATAGASDADAARARAGVIETAHGPLHTPAFVPLATKATVRGLSTAEVAALGFEIVLGNTFHLFLNPSHELIAKLGGLHSFMRWDGPIITDSGGFQVFSMGHGTVADEIKGRSHGAAAASTADEATARGAILAIDEQGVRFRSYYDGQERALTPEVSMAVQAALGSDVALVFDECTPFHVSRDYTARSTERTHRWLARCLDWHAANGPPQQLVYGIVQGGIYEDLRIESAAAVAASGCDGVAIGGSLGREKAQMHEVVDWTTRELDRIAPERPPRHGAGRRPRARLARQPREGALARGAGADLAGVPVPCLRRRLLARVPALPRAQPRADRHAAGDAAQPELRRTADG
jgi:queuine tRNA-ribosyltransferase